jgi:hypothetical protein
MSAALQDRSAARDFAEQLNDRDVTDAVSAPVSVD